MTGVMFSAEVLGIFITILKIVEAHYTSYQKTIFPKVK
jgi:hypothetical protein